MLERKFFAYIFRLSFFSLLVYFLHALKKCSSNAISTLGERKWSLRMFCTINIVEPKMFPKQPAIFLTTLSL